MLELTSEAPVIEMEPVFSIDGRVFEMPKRVTVNTALIYMRMARKQGPEAAISWAVERVLGEEPYIALMECESLTKDQLAQVMEIVRTKLMGAVEAPN
ncbi:MAG: hypothetical protein JWO67_837 [Streptosporangiaceae bacterium]|nr:hypothetical protein [Streptosporangiaceae bacterium]